MASLQTVNVRTADGSTIPVAFYAIDLPGEVTVYGQVMVPFSDGDIESSVNPKAMMSHRAPDSTHIALEPSTNSATLLVENEHRHAYQVFNYTDKILFVKAGEDCTEASFSHLIQPSMGYEPTAPVVYTGIYTYCTEAGAVGSIQVTEYM